jgi:hypothetical protein
MATITIKNNNPRVEHVAYAYLATVSGGTKGMDFRLVPGNNEIDAEAWAKAKKLKIVQANLESGAWVEAGASMREAADEVSIGLVHETLDRRLLMKWKGTERRPTVVAAINHQLEQTDPANKAQQDTDGIDLKPRNQPSSFDGADIAAQVAPIVEEEEAKPKARSTPGGKRR